MYLMNYMDYQNNGIISGIYGIWHTYHISPNEHYKFVTNDKYQLNISNPFKPLAIEKQPEELGKKKESDAEKSTQDKCS